MATDDDLHFILPGEGWRGDEFDIQIGRRSSVGSDDSRAMIWVSCDGVTGGYPISKAKLAKLRDWLTRVIDDPATAWIDAP